MRSLAMTPVRVEAPIAAYWSESRTPSTEEVDALSQALDEAELARDELRHRVKNAFTAVQGRPR